MRRRQSVTFALLIIALVSSFTRAEVVRIDIDSRVDVLEGRPFGEGGAYEKLTGTVHFAFDPANPYNARIVDLDLAPRNHEGLVEASANFMVLKPKDEAKSNGIAFIEVSNRGGKASLRYFHRATGRPSNGDPTEPSHFGDGLLMNMGVTIIWIGWQHDVPERPGVLRLQVPIARNDDGSSITGLVRSDWVVDEDTLMLEVAHRNHIAYPVLDPADPANRLTVRAGRYEPRLEVVRDSWRFGMETEEGWQEDPTRISLRGGFKKGYIYELVYRAADPKIVGLGLAAIRDIAAYSKYDETCPFPAQHAVAFGVSQTGRFLRHFLFQGFNTDERNRKVYDGMLIHTAGAGRGSFNHRFAQPSRDAHRFSAFFYPTDLFPFASRPQRHIDTGIPDGLLSHAFNESHQPKIFHTNTGYEYYGRAAALTHIALIDIQDVEPFDFERIYHLASGQHFVSPFPPRDGSRIGETNAYRGNPLDFLVTLRALLVRLIEWVETDTTPPPSQYPHIQDRTLVTLNRVRFPEIPGVTFPTVAHRAHRVDYGPRWAQGIIDHQPPILGNPFHILVPQVDEFGNELGGVPTIEIMEPLATYAPWCLRHEAPANRHELDDFYGTYIPLPRTEAEGMRSHDHRPDIELRYRTKAKYLERVSVSASMLIDRGLLLPQDRRRVIDRAEAHWDWIHEQPRE